MKNLQFPLLLVFLCALFVSGCDLAQPENPGQAAPPDVAANEPKQVEAPADQPKGNALAQTETVTVKPGVGFSGKGASLTSADGENPMGIITVPVKTLFNVKDRLVLQQIEAGMKYFKGEHDRVPANWAEFEEKIIKANGIKLPTLPAGQKYVYDPKDGELKIEKPK